LPELPEVEIVARGLAARLGGLKIKKVEVWLDKIVQGGTETFIREVTGARVGGVRRKGKVILIDLGRHLVGVHLKMTGTFLFAPPDKPLPKHTHLRLTFEGAGFELRYQDVRQFGWFHLLKPEELDSWEPWASLGPDGLGLDQATLRRRLSGRRGRIKPLLLNQTVLAGMGNIYTDEALFQAGIHPLQPAESLGRTRIARLHEAIHQILCEAIDCGGSSISDFQDAEGKLGYFQTRHRVYGRLGKPCLSCGRPVERMVVGGRSTFFCPTCQPLRRARGRSGH